MFISSHNINTKYMNELKIKRIYLPYNEDDGFRILIDRLWPRGISKVNAFINEHCKYIAPSTEIRKAFGLFPEAFLFLVTCRLAVSKPIAFRRPSILQSKSPQEASKHPM